MTTRMSSRFIIPDWMPRAEPPPPPPPADPFRVEHLVNQFIDAKHDALFTAPDAYYRTTGIDAIDGVPAILDRLNAARDGMLDQARHDGERQALGERLDDHLVEAMQGIERHATAQRE